jgi:hypothetical protein
MPSESSVMMFVVSGTSERRAFSFTFTDEDSTAYRDQAFAEQRQLGKFFTVHPESDTVL